MGKLFCRHWYLPIMIDVKVKEWGYENREELAVFSDTKTKCIFCGKLKPMELSPFLKSRQNLKK